jgi:hypothetical protein
MTLRGFAVNPGKGNQYGASKGAAAFLGPRIGRSEVPGAPMSLIPLGNEQLPAPSRGTLSSSAQPNLVAGQPHHRFPTASSDLIREQRTFRSLRVIPSAL